jgi:hypothetical protein
MAKTLMQLCGTINTYAPGVTEYLPIANSQNPGTVAVEVRRQLKSKFSATLSKLRIRVTANSLSTAATTIRFRKNNANGNQNVVISAGATGTFEDTTNSDSVVDTDLYDLSIVVAAGGTGTITPFLIQMEYSKAAGVTQVMAGVGVPTSATASTSYFASFSGSLVNAVGVVEARKQVVVRAAATLANLQIYVDTNGRATDTLLRSRKNSANGNLLITISAGATGFFEDSSNSDSLVDGDTFNYSFVTGTGAGTIGWTLVAATLTPTGTLRTPLLAASNNSAQTFSTATLFQPFSSTVVGSIATEANGESEFTYAATLSNMLLSVSANTHAGTKTIKLRKNGADGNQTFTITAGATGYFEDTTNSDSVVDGDTATMQLAGGTSGSLSVVMAGVHQTVSDPVSGDLLTLNLMGVGQ